MSDGKGILEYAVAYAEKAKLPVFPTKPDKTPYISQHKATTDPALVREMFTQFPDAGIGCRLPPGMVLLDIDPRHGGLVVWTALNLAFDGLTPGRQHHSGRGDGGFHAWYLTPEGWSGRLSIDPLNEWAKSHGLGAKAGIDLLWHGHRYTILPPSLYAATGKPYEWDIGGEPGPIPPELLALITAPNPPPRPAPLVAVEGLVVPLRELHVDSPADWYGENHTWSQVLAPLGWRCVKGDGEQDGSLWQHPTATAAHSASISYGLLFVYSGNTPIPETEPGSPHGHTKFRAYAVLAHGGDLSAAAKAVNAARGKGVRVEPEPEPEAEAEGEGEDGSSYDPIDLTPYLDGTVALPVADCLTMSDGRSLLHRGRLNGIHGDSGTGKSWLMALLVEQEVNAGQTIGVCDLEDTPAPLIVRLRQLGVADEHIASRVVFFHPDESWSARNVGRMIATLRERRAVHLIVDSLGEAFALDGINENNDAEVAPWLVRVCRRVINELGVGITLIDHGTKAKETPLDPSGSKRKRAALTGTAWYMTTSKPFTKERGGKAELTCAKDRHGAYRRGVTVAELRMSPVSALGRCTLKLDPRHELPEGVHGDVLTEAKLGLLREGRRARKPQSKSQWIVRVEGRKDWKLAAFDELVESGDIVAVGEGKVPKYVIAGRETTEGKSAGQTVPEVLDITRESPGQTVPEELFTKRFPEDDEQL